MIKRISLFFLFSVLALMLLLSMLFSMIQTDWAKQRICHTLSTIAKRQGFELTVKKIEGISPFQLTLNEVYIEGKNHNHLAIEELHVKISPFSFFKKKLIITNFFAEDVAYLYTSNSEESGDEKKLVQTSTLNLPFALKIKHIDLRRVYISDLTKQRSLSLKIKGDFSSNRELNRFFSKASIEDLYNRATHVNLRLRTLSHNDIELKVNGFIEDSGLFSQWINSYRITKLQFSGNIFAPNSRWKNFFQNHSTQKIKPIKTEITLHGSRIEAPFIPDEGPFDIKANFSFWPDHSVDIAMLRAHTPSSDIIAQGHINSDSEVANLELNYSISDLSSWKKETCGELSGSVEYFDDNFNAHFSLKDFSIASKHLPDLRGKIKGQKRLNHWVGDLTSMAHKDQMNVQLASEFIFTNDRILTLDDFTMQYNGNDLSSHISIDFAKHQIEGSGYAFICDLEQIESFLPIQDLSGSIGADFSFASEANNWQIINLHSDLIAHNLRYRFFSVQQLSLEANLVDLLGQCRGKIDIEATDGHLPKGDIEQLSLSLRPKRNSIPYILTARGTFREPFELFSDGVWIIQEKGFEMMIEQLTAQALNRSFALIEPFSISYNEPFLQITPCEIDLTDGFFSCQWHQNDHAISAYSRGLNFPLALLSLSSPNFSLDGAASWESNLHGDEHDITGFFHMLFDQSSFTQFSKAESIQAKGNLRLNLSNEHLQIHSNIIASGQQFFEFSGNIPLFYSAEPFSLKLNQNAPFHAELLAEGRIESLFNFVNIGTQNISGLLSSHLLFSQTLSNPSMQGFMELQNGLYENYFIGSYLRHIDMHIEANNHRLLIERLSADDGKEGQVSATGEIHLDPKLDFPFVFTLDLDHLQTLSTDMLTSSFSGIMQVKGTTEKAIAKGNLRITQAEFTIPDVLPVEIPNLPVDYVNFTQEVKKRLITALEIYPIYLNLSLTAGDNFFVRGRGLNSEWSGNLDVNGTYTDYTLKGKLFLERGEYLFAGKAFNLTSGEITLKDRGRHRTDINLQGSLDIDNYTITAMLRGPLRSPKLTFQSLPQAPTSTILSYLLFNKDISEISPIQAVQLAQTIVTLSGKTNQDMLELIRKRLGVDRLTLVSSGDADELSLQIGKYLTKGIMVTLTQGRDSSQVSVEVELGKGFIFEAETQEEEEGKFSLKWSYSY